MMELVRIQMGAVVIGWKLEIVVLTTRKPFALMKMFGWTRTPVKNFA
jgi:hypothetical protein